MIDVYDNKDIYDRLGDNISKEIYENRILYSLTRNVKYIRQMVSSNKHAKDFLDVINETNENLLFGLGAWGKRLVRIWPEKWVACIDNDDKLWGQNFYGLNIISPRCLLKEYKNKKIFVSTRLYNKQIIHQLLDIGIRKENIIDVGNILNMMFKDQYFDLPYMEKNDQEIFVDAGCFDGKSTIEFTHWCKNKYNKIWTFEADKDNFFKSQKTLNYLIKMNKVELLHAGLWNEEKVLHFDGAKEMASAINSEGLFEVNGITLDDKLQGVPVTFIKMDIEGAEINAIQGSENLIKINKPKLAISIYHNFEDIFIIPKLLLKYRSDYVFYLRHYSVGETETILYAL